MKNDLSSLFRIHDAGLIAVAYDLPRVISVVFSSSLSQVLEKYLLFGKSYQFCSVKVVYLSSTLLFEAASAICGAALNSTALVVGRAIWGVGAAGIFAGTLPDQETTKIPWMKKLPQLGASGTTALVPGVVCLALALHGCDGRNIALLTLMAVFVIAFVLVQIYLPATASLPPRIFKRRSVASGFWQTLCVGSGNYMFIFGSVSGGALNTKIGYYTRIAIVGSTIMAVGAGLLTTVQVDTAAANWFGYQVLYGVGLVVSSLTALSAFTLEWRSSKKPDPKAAKPDAEQAAAAEEEKQEG
ncbi:hypothetical protein DL767_001920 [Monosporascus sp. MG133]|nr:hypothetical protein DL767_001920 [Monosporascus sp. MG133]